MGKESELLHAVKNADVSTVRKYLVKFKSGPKGSMYLFFSIFNLFNVMESIHYQIVLVIYKSLLN